MVYVLTVVHNRLDSTKKFLDCLNKQTFKKFETVVIDDGSTDGTDVFLREEKVTVLRGNGNLWWTGGINLGLKYILDKASSTDFILIINDDVIIKRNFVSELHKTSLVYNRAIVGTICKNNEKKIIRTAVKYKWKPFKAETTINNPDTLSSRGTLVPTEVFRKIGLFDQKNFPHYTSDFDFFYRAKKAGYKLILSQDIFVVTEVQPHRKSLTNIKYAGNIYNETRFLWKHSPGYFWKLINISRFFLSQLFVNT